jgi:hypothetical protein
MWCEVLCGKERKEENVQSWIKGSKVQDKSNTVSKLFDRLLLLRCRIPIFYLLSLKGTCFCLSKYQADYFSLTIYYSPHV